MFVATTLEPSARRVFSAPAITTTACSSATPDLLDRPRGLCHPDERTMTRGEELKLLAPERRATPEIKLANRALRRRKYGSMRRSRACRTPAA